MVFRLARRNQGELMPEKVVLAYSGGLDTSIIIPWLKENYAYDVIAMVADVGQGEDLDAVVAKAYKTGASKVVVRDMREEFLTDYVFPAIAAGAVYEHKYREDCLVYAESRGIPVAASREKIHSRDRNLLHISHEGGELEDPANAPLESTWQWTSSPQSAPNEAENVEIGFEQGIPISVNGSKLSPVALLEELNDIGARNGVGRIDLV